MVRFCHNMGHREMAQTIAALQVAGLADLTHHIL